MTRNFEKVLKESPDYFVSGLATTTAEFLKERVFNTTEEFALLEERARLLREVGSKISAIGFMNFVAKSGFDCPRLVDLILDTLPGFRDQAIYHGNQVFFYKRAQILVADLVGAFDDYRSELAKHGQSCEDVPDFTNKEELTMFADYRVP
jgi:hypothetical protein